MTIDAIQLLISVAKHRNITRAALERHISQPAASRQLKNLEEELGIKLTKKSGRGIELTRSGIAYVKDVLPIMSQLNSVKEKYMPTRDTLTIAASRRTSKYVLPRLMAHFRSEYPTTKMTLLTRRSVDIEKLLIEEAVDLAIATNPTPHKSFVTEPCYREPLEAFIAVEQPHEKFQRMEAFENVTPIVLKSRDEGSNRVEEYLAKLENAGTKLSTIIRCDSPGAVKEFVRQGVGIGFLYLNSIKRELESRRCQSIQMPGLDVVAENCLIYSKGKELSRVALDFRAFLRTALTKAEAPKVSQTRTDKITRRGLTSTLVRPTLLAWLGAIVFSQWLACTLM